MKSKKTQITIFVIIAIVIILGVAAFFVIKQNSSLNVETSLDRDLTKKVESCATELLNSGIGLIGIQGGYIALPENFVATSDSKIAYGFYEGQNTLVSLAEMEKELSSFLEFSLPECLNQTIIKNYEIKKGVASVKTKISADYVSVDIIYPITISSAESTYTFDKYFVKTNSILGSLHDAMNNIILSQAENISYINTLTFADSGYNAQIYTLDENTQIYSIGDSMEKFKFVTALDTR